MYPNGSNRMKARGHVSIFLTNQASVNVKIEYEVFVVSQLEQIWESSGLSFSLVIYVYIYIYILAHEGYLVRHNNICG